MVFKQRAGLVYQDGGQEAERVRVFIFLQSVSCSKVKLIWKFNLYYVLCCSNLNYEQQIGLNYNLTQFKNEYPTKLIIHGYLANRFHSATAPLKNAYLARGRVNLIMTDWQEGAVQSYGQSRGLVPFVGERIAKLLEGLIR